MIKKFKKRPEAEIEALLFTGDNPVECLKFVGKGKVDNTLKYPNVITRDGTVLVVYPGDYIIKETSEDGHHVHPYRKDLFEAKYMESTGKVKSTPEKLFPLYVTCINRIEDYFEHRSASYQDKLVVMRHVDALVEAVKKHG